MMISDVQKMHSFMLPSQEDPLVKRELFAVSLRKERKKVLLEQRRE